jgi:hypothetical protein
MAKHHTKDKGDKGLGFVIADLLKNNIQVATLLSEHLPFDCIAISEKGELRRVSVKYRALDRGAVEVALKSSWTDSHGTHIKQHDMSSYDAIAVYNPESNQCFYVNVSEVKTKVIRLRVQSPKNNQTTGILMAKDYLHPARLFKEL